MSSAEKPRLFILIFHSSHAEKLNMQKKKKNLPGVGLWRRKYRPQAWQTEPSLLLRKIYDLKSKSLYIFVTVTFEWPPELYKWWLFLVVLGFEFRALSLLGKCSALEPQPQTEFLGVWVRCIFELKATSTSHSVCHTRLYAINIVE
jgi:hypothetical protein